MKRRLIFVIYTFGLMNYGIECVRLARALAPIIWDMSDPFPINAPEVGACDCASDAEYPSDLCAHHRAEFEAWRLA